MIESIAFMVAAMTVGGQLIVESYGLAEVAARGHAVYEVEVVAPAKARLPIELRVVRVFHRPREGSPARHELAQGSTFKAKIYGGVVWDDPHKSPLETRLEGSTPARSLQKGDLAFAVPHDGSTAEIDLLAPDDANRRKIAILFEPAATTGASALDSAPSDQLTRDLLDRDLADLAYAVLEKRGPLPANVLLGARGKVLEKFWTSSDPRRRTAFLEELAQTARDEATDRILFNLLRRNLSTVPMSALAPLLAKLDPEDKKRRGLIDEMHRAIASLLNAPKDEKTPLPDLSPLIPFMLTYEKVRETYAREDAALLPFAESLPADAQVTLAVGLLAIAQRSKQAGKSTDLFLLETAAAIAGLSPSPALIPALAKLDPKRGHPNLTMAKFMEIGAAVASKHPAEAARIHALIAPMLEYGIPADAKDVARYREVVTVADPTPSTVTFELAFGEAKYLPGGVRVSFDMGEKLPSLSIYTKKHHGRSEGLTEDEPWFREGYEEPFRYDVERVADQRRLKITIAPAATAPEQKTDPQLYALARTAAKEAGCPEYEEHQHESWHGIFLFHGSGPNGKRCRLILGGYSGRVSETRSLSNANK